VKLVSFVTIFSLANVFGFGVLPSYAADSRWLLCDNSHLALNLYEHRSGLGRATSFTLLFGGYAFAGQLTDTDAGRVFLIGTSQDNTNFKGDISVDYLQDVVSVSLKGILNLNAGRFNINTQLKCKEMRSDL
jgi:hypothetical protein